MNEIKIEYKLLVFLYAYLHQIDLSLDRSRWGSVSDLSNYYKTQIAPEKVANHLLRKFDLDKNRVYDVYYVGEITSFSKIRTWILLHLKKQSFLSKQELYYCCQKLLVLDKYLETNLEIHKLELEKLRIDLSKLTYGSLQFKLYQKDRIKTQMVEHFLQNENLNAISIEEFSKGLHL